MMVEFVGAAGSGKTFLSGQVIKALEDAGRVAADFDLLEINKVSGRNALLTARAFALTVQTKQNSLYRFKHTFKTIARYSIRRDISEQCAGIYITSEGLIHRTITMHRNSSGQGVSQLADMLYQRIAPPDVAVFLDVSAETAFARRGARGRPNDEFTFESVKEDVQIVASSIDVMAQIKQKFHPSMQIIRVNTEQEGAKDATDAVIAAIRAGSASGRVQG